MRIPARFIAFVTVFQSILFLTHFFIYETWMFGPARSGNTSGSWLKMTFGVLSLSFLAATLLAFRYSNPAVRTLYRIAAVWLGMVSFLFLAACGSWLVFGLARIAGVNLNFHLIVEVLYAAFFFNEFATTEIYTLSLHDALPIVRRATCSMSARRKTSASGLRPTPGSPRC